VTNGVEVTGLNFATNQATNLIPVLIYSNTTVSITKAVEGISLNGIVGPPVPGSTITYLLTYSNTGTFEGINFRIWDVVQPGQSYKAESMRNGGTGSVYGTAISNSDVVDSDRTEFLTNMVVFTQGILAIGEAGKFYFQTIVTNISALFQITNTAFVDAASLLTFTNSAVITNIVATNHGGRILSPPDRTNTISSVTYFTLGITNLGNASRSFGLVLTNTNYNLSTGWDYGIWIVSNGNDTIFGQTPLLAPGSSFSFRVKISNLSTLGSGAWVEFDIIAVLNSFATNYTGDDGTAYGGDLGLDSTGTRDSAYDGRIVQQSNAIGGTPRIRQTVVGVPVLMLSKIKELTLLGGVVSSNVPGARLTYVLTYTNAGSGSATNFLIRDLIEVGQIYVAGSMKKGGSTDNYAGASSETDPVDGDNSSIAGNITSFTLALLPPGASGRFFFQTFITNMPSGTLITNISQATSENVASNSYSPVVTNIVSAIRGGRMARVNDRTNDVTAPTYFTNTITNKGNVSTLFDLFISHTNYSSGAGDWTVEIVEAGTDTVIGNSGLLSIGASFTFRIKITPVLTLTNNDWIDFRVSAQAGGDTSSTNYLGDDGVIYGGDIGVDWNGIGQANPGYVYPQGNPEIRLTIAFPSVTLTKAGTPSPAPPGSIVTYRITFTNEGNSAASGVKIEDTIPPGTVYVGGSLKIGNTGSTYGSASGLSDGGGRRRRKL